MLNTMYKIYVMVLEDRLGREMEEKEMLPHSQIRFRKGMSAKDNIYVLNYAVNRVMQREGGRVWALFVDIKSTFDSVDRGVLWRALEERGVSEELLERLKVEVEVVRMFQNF